MHPAVVVALPRVLLVAVVVGIAHLISIVQHG